MATESPSQAASTGANYKLFGELDAYPWDRDTAFQNALAAFLGSNSNPSQARDLTLRAQCYYYARKNNLPPIDYDAYRAHVLSQIVAILSEPSLAAQASSGLSGPAPGAEQSISDASSSPPVPSSKTVQATEPYNPSDESPPYPVSFAQIVELITSGAPIPGIRGIPPTVLSDQATKPKASKRPKPWEKNTVEEESTFGDHRDQVITQEILVEDITVQEEIHE